MERVDTIGDGDEDDDDDDDADSEEEEVISTLISSARSAASKCAALREDGGVENFISTTQNVIRNEEHSSFHQKVCPLRCSENTLTFQIEPRKQRPLLSWQTLRESIRLSWRFGVNKTTVPLLDFSPSSTMLMLLLPFPDGDRGRVVEHLAVAVPVIMEANGSSSLFATPKHEIIRDNFCAKQLKFCDISIANQREAIHPSRRKRAARKGRRRSS